jgi:MFS family permease
VSYPAGIYASYFTEQIFPDANLSLTLAFTIALNAGYIPGTLIGALIVDKLGPKKTICLFLGLQAIFGFALAGAFGYFKVHTGGLIAMYVIYIAMGEAGPGNCLGLLAAKAVAPTPVRGVMYGFAAAIGKVGAFVGSYIFVPTQNKWPETDDMHYAVTFYIGSSLAVLAMLCVIFFIPPVVPDGIIKMDEEFFAYLESNGYDMRNVGLASEGAHPGRVSEEEEGVSSSKVAS